MDEYRSKVLSRHVARRQSTSNRISFSSLSSWTTAQRHGSIKVLGMRSGQHGPRMAMTRQLEQAINLGIQPCNGTMESSAATENLLRRLLRGPTFFSAAWPYRGSNERDFSAFLHSPGDVFGLIAAGSLFWCSKRRMPAIHCSRTTVYLSIPSSTSLIRHLTPVTRVETC